VMPTSDYPIVQQLHRDRTARIVSEHRLLRLPTRTRATLFTRTRRERPAVAQLAPSC